MSDKQQLMVKSFKVFSKAAWKGVVRNNSRNKRVSETNIGVKGAQIECYVSPLGAPQPRALQTCLLSRLGSPRIWYGPPLYVLQESIAAKCPRALESDCLARNLTPSIIGSVVSGKWR